MVLSMVMAPLIDAVPADVVVPEIGMYLCLVSIFAYGGTTTSIGTAFTSYSKIFVPSRHLVIVYDSNTSICLVLFSTVTPVVGTVIFEGTLFDSNDLGVDLPMVTYA